MLKYILITALFFISSVANASSNVVANNKTDLSKIENYLQNIKYLSSTFIQESHDGGYSTGKFYLSRPGKMRIDYDAPANILVVVNGSVLTYQDIELEENSYLRTNTTPASFLTRKKISFSATDIDVTSFEKVDDLIKVSVVKKNKPEAGEFTLIFESSPMKFLRMEVKDELEQVTKVTLEDHDFTSKINNKLFIVKNSQLPK